MIPHIPSAARRLLLLLFIFASYIILLLLAIVPLALALVSVDSSSSKDDVIPLLPPSSASSTYQSPLLQQLDDLLPFSLPFLLPVDQLLNGQFDLNKLVSWSWWLEVSSSAWKAQAGHLLLELGCLVMIMYLWLRKPYDPRDQEKLSKEEEDELIRSWRPDPIVPPLPPAVSLRRSNVISSYRQQHLIIDGKTYLNFASHNYLGLANNTAIKEACRATIDKYGVGSCGPRGFYGTFDIHLEIEKQISAFFRAPECILYSDGIATLASVIPAFSKRGDLIVCDDSVNFGIQQGIRLSRSNVLYYKHNDMEDLERVLQQVQERDQARHSSSSSSFLSTKKLNRRFIICEGISQYYGDITPLAHIVRLKERFKYRLILDDTLGIGVLGATGRGSLEHAGLTIEHCDLLCASMDAALATVGGFCVGDKQAVDHQRLSGAGYCFSASSPPYTGTAGIVALQMIERDQSMTTHIQKQAVALRKALTQIPGFILVGGITDTSPLCHLHLSPSVAASFTQRSEIEIFLLKILNKLFDEDNLVIAVPEYIAAERALPPPSLMITVSVQHDSKDIDKLVKALKRVTTELLPKHTH